MDLGHHVVAIDADRHAARRAQRDMQNRALFCDVDLVAAEHRVDPAAEIGLGGDGEEQFDGFVDDAVLRVVGEEADGFEREPFAAGGVLGEELAEVPVLDLGVMGFEGLPACASLRD